MELYWCTQCNSNFIKNLYNCYTCLMNNCNSVESLNKQNLVVQCKKT